MSKPLASFRIYPDDRALYFKVYVWPSKAAMLAHLRSMNLSASRDTVAQCSSYSIAKIKGGHWRTKPILGEINFHAKQLNAEVVSHECGHAALSWARRKKFKKFNLEDLPIGPLVSRNEERFCYALGHMVNQIAIQLTKARLW